MRTARRDATISTWLPTRGIEFGVVAVPSLSSTLLTPSMLSLAVRVNSIVSTTRSPSTRRARIRSMVLAICSSSRQVRESSVCSLIAASAPSPPRNSKPQLMRAWAGQVVMSTLNSSPDLACRRTQSTTVLSRLNSSEPSASTSAAFILPKRAPANDRPRAPASRSR